jgi:hypothetical protein
LFASKLSLALAVALLAVPALAARPRRVSRVDHDDGTPARGDQVTEAGVGTFELAAPGGEPHWRYSDQTRTLYRVHCKRVS